MSSDVWKSEPYRKSYQWLKEHLQPGHARGKAFSSGMIQQSERKTLACIGDKQKHNEELLTYMERRQENYPCLVDIVLEMGCKEAAKRLAPPPASPESPQHLARASAAEPAPQPALPVQHTLANDPSPSNEFYCEQGTPMMHSQIMLHHEDRGKVQVQKEGMVKAFSSFILFMEVANQMEFEEEGRKGDLLGADSRRLMRLLTERKFRQVEVRMMAAQRLKFWDHARRNASRRYGEEMKEFLAAQEDKGWKYLMNTDAMYGKVADLGRVEHSERQRMRRCFRKVLNQKKFDYKREYERRLQNTQRSDSFTAENMVEVAIGYMDPYEFNDHSCQLYMEDPDRQPHGYPNFRGMEQTKEDKERNSRYMYILFKEEWELKAKVKDLEEEIVDVLVGAGLRQWAALKFVEKCCRSSADQEECLRYVRRRGIAPDTFIETYMTELFSLRRELDHQMDFNNRYLKTLREHDGHVEQRMEELRKEPGQLDRQAEVACSHPSTGSGTGRAHFAETRQPYGDVVQRMEELRTDASSSAPQMDFNNRYLKALREDDGHVEQRMDELRKEPGQLDRQAEAACSHPSTVSGTGRARFAETRRRTSVSGDQHLDIQGLTLSTRCPPASLSRVVHDRYIDSIFKEKEELRAAVKEHEQAVVDELREQGFDEEQSLQFAKRRFSSKDDLKACLRSTRENGTTEGTFIEKNMKKLFKFRRELDHQMNFNIRYLKTLREHDGDVDQRIEELHTEASSSASSSASQRMVKKRPGLAVEEGATRVPFISRCPVLEFGCEEFYTEPTAWYYGRCTGQVFMGDDGYCVCKHVLDSGDIHTPCSKGNYTSLFQFYELSFKCKNPEHKTYEQADTKWVQADFAGFALSVRDTKDATTSSKRLTGIQVADYLLKVQFALTNQSRELAKEPRTRRPPSTSSFIDCA